LAKPYTLKTMKSLGKGLDALIPQNEEKNNEPQRHLADDILSYQESLEEPIHGIRFISETISSILEEPKITTAEFRELPKFSLGRPGAGLALERTADAGLAQRKREDNFYPPPKTGKMPDLNADANTPKIGESIFWIEIEKIDTNPFQPRREFEENALASLADSIKSYGILQPLLVSKQEEETSRGLSVKYQLIAGERRWRAARLAGLREVPVIIRKDKLHDRLKLELALIENVQREDLNPVERALAFKQLVDNFRLTQKEISEKIGKSREYVTNSLRLLTLPNEARDLIQQNVISEGHGRALLMLAGAPEKQSELLQQILQAKINVREAEFAARALLGHRHVPHRKDIAKLEFEDRAWQKQLEDALGTRVSLVKMDGGKGKIIVEFYSEEELQNILDKMIREV